MIDLEKIFGIQLYSMGTVLYKSVCVYIKYI